MADSLGVARSFAASTTARGDALEPQVLAILNKFTAWLDRYGETSWDHQSYFAGPIGRRAKALYYRQKLVGTLAVSPMILSEALVPGLRRLFHRPIRFPIADAHYAMGFAFLAEATGDATHLRKAVHFLDELRASRCTGFNDYCWGYPFDWVTRNGIINQQTPLITSTPYAYEAFLQVQELDPAGQWMPIIRSIARHAATDIKDFRTSRKASSCSYTPFDKGGVLNAAAYRAFLLTSASQVLGESRYGAIAERNLNFVLENQNADGSWYYATDGVRDFVDHFHTCFVMKALAKVHSITGHSGCFEALARGVDYYVANLFAPDGLPRPFAKAPRLTVYRRELYDCAECINLCLLLRARFPRLDATLETVVAGTAKHWTKRDGSFRSRQLMCGWDDVPMHRWGQSQMFRSLAFWLRDRTRTAASVTPVADAALPEGASDVRNSRAV